MLAQSVSGMNPILTSSFSGLSEPCAYTAARNAGAMVKAPAAAVCKTLRRLIGVSNISVMAQLLGQVKMDINDKGVLTTLK
jgi:hypothetical protein